MFYPNSLPRHLGELYLVPGVRDASTVANSEGIRLRNSKAGMSNTNLKLFELRFNSFEIEFLVEPVR